MLSSKVVEVEVIVDLGTSIERTQVDREIGQS